MIKLRINVSAQDKLGTISEEQPGVIDTEQGA